MNPAEGTAQGGVAEDVEIRGHIIDSLILPKVLDIVLAAGGSFRIKSVTIGQQRTDPSFARIEVAAPTAQRLQEILDQISDHGAVRIVGEEVRWADADCDGAFPEGFYSTTNQRTEALVGGEWHVVEDQEMDCSLTWDRHRRVCRCVPMTEVRRGMPIAVGHLGIRVHPAERQQSEHGFGFMNSAVSTEKPKGVVIREIARQLALHRDGPGKTLLVGGPAIVHTGSGPLVGQLIRDGYIHRLFAGNALATHDVEQALFGTSLGVNLDVGHAVDAGHEHHLRAINRIRRAGSIAAAVEQGVLKSGIMYECVRRGVPFHLSGSIRDDGPLPDVVTDALECQRIMREAIRDVSFCLMIATTLHSVAVGNLLPASVSVVCVDINPSTVIKLNDRGSFQTVGLVTDVEPFLRAVVAELERTGS
jgi:lysine-ketoglutarate reductase/saccharopine dehydrogenase-like protein (TIGR00300 family)